MPCSIEGSSWWWFQVAPAGGGASCEPAGEGSGLWGFYRGLRILFLIGTDFYMFGFAIEAVVLVCGVLFGLICCGVFFSFYNYCFVSHVLGLFGNQRWPNPVKKSGCFGISGVPHKNQAKTTRNKNQTRQVFGVSPKTTRKQRKNPKPTTKTNQKPTKNQTPKPQGPLPNTTAQVPRRFRATWLIRITRAPRFKASASWISKDRWVGSPKADHASDWRIFCVFKRIFLLSEGPRTDGVFFFWSVSLQILEVLFRIPMDLLLLSILMEPSRQVSFAETKMRSSAIEGLSITHHVQCLIFKWLVGPSILRDAKYCVTTKNEHAMQNGVCLCFMSI